MSVDRGGTDCTLSVQLQAPARGWYSVGDVYAALLVQTVWRAKPRVTAKVWFQNAPEDGSEDVLDVAEGTSQKWFLLHPSTAEEPVRSRCDVGQTLNFHIAADMNVFQGSSASFLSVWEFPTDSAPGMALTWHPCEG